MLPHGPSTPLPGNVIRFEIFLNLFQLIIFVFFYRWGGQQALKRTVSLKERVKGVLGIGRRK